MIRSFPRNTRDALCTFEMTKILHFNLFKMKKIEIQTKGDILTQVVKDPFREKNSKMV